MIVRLSSCKFNQFLFTPDELTLGIIGRFRLVLMLLVVKNLNGKTYKYLLLQPHSIFQHATPLAGVTQEDNVDPSPPAPPP